MRSPESDVETTKWISKHVKHDWQEALHIFNLVKRKASVVTFNVAISACARGAIWQEALSLLQDLALQRLQATLISYSAVINSCEKAGEWRCALACLDVMKQKRLQPNVIAFNAALSACTKGGRWQLALCIFNLRADGQCSLVTYNSAISALATVLTSLECWRCMCQRRPMDSSLLLCRQSMQLGARA